MAPELGACKLHGCGGSPLYALVRLQHDHGYLTTSSVKEDVSRCLHLSALGLVVVVSPPRLLPT